MNSTVQGTGMGSEMIDIHKVLVADRIQQLRRDATEANAGRRLAAGRSSRDMRRAAAMPSVRYRLGRLLIGVGEAIAGRPIAGDEDATSVAHPA